MKDEYYWSSVIKNLTEIEFAALIDAAEGLSHANKWDHVLPHKHNEDVDDLIREIRSLERDLKDAEDRIDDLELSEINAKNILDLLNQGEIDKAIETLENIV